MYFLGALRHAGDVAGYWSSTVHFSTSYLYDLYFNETNIIPSGEFERWAGFTVHAKSITKYHKLQTIKPKTTNRRNICYNRPNREL